MSSFPEKNPQEAKKGIQIIRGIPMSLVFKRELVEEALDHEPLDDDIIIATYPKTGTTWMSYIVQQILTKGESYPSMEEMFGKVIPFLEMSGIAAVNAITTKPRVYKHHLALDKVKYNPKTRIIYVYRRPEDTVVSFYHMMKNFDDTLDFNEFFEDFMDGSVCYADYFDHILSYWKLKDNKNFLLVSYEKLLLNRKEEILRIAKFLGEEYYEILAGDQSVLNNIIRNTSFDYMKKNLPVNLPLDHNNRDSPKKKTDFFRKGIIGDGRNSLNEEQLKRLRDYAKEKLKGNELLSEWYNED